MANIGTSIAAWSTTEASNQPDSTDSATLAGDLRALQAAVRYIYAQDTIASAATTDLGSKSSGGLTISGTTTITGFGTIAAGIVKRCVFSGALTLTYNATSLLLPGNANIVTVAGDTAEFESLGSGNWRCNWYARDSALAALSGANGDITSLTAVTALTTAAGVDVHGTNTNDAADAGYVGELITSSVAAGSAVPLTTDTVTNITSISLTAGDWDVSGTVVMAPAATTSSTIKIGGISSTSATLGALGTYSVQTSEAQVTGAISSFQPTPAFRLLISSTTTVYLLASATFTVSTMSAYGTIRARRIR